MNFVEIATSAVSILIPYLAKVAEGAAQKAGESVWEKAEAIYQAIVSKFSEDGYAEQTLKRLKEKPSNEERQKALVGILAEKAEEDSGFAKQLNRLISNAAPEQPSGQSQDQTSTGDHNNNLQIGGNTGDLTFH
ncbi:MAG: hypothetical protein F6J94_07000 [Moorea sp. SIO1F2]|uniref:hypothetical protein n=1 Tax=unclassified Moorena TaxID=2683338 RepID=UPI0013B846BD|nr:MULTISPECIES: hypothetical protein [unclassified Moorena]NEP27144.1 hypothetical protein [Moorena sp. SIO3I6]NEQ81556.1 hypothetical protein [Moorena sp. SIO2I5]NET81711.1 hypothetical protein [Moorena sp. SIO1F2]